MNSFNFAPHVTIFTTPKNNTTNFYKNILHLAAKQFKAINLYLENIEHANTFTKNLFYPVRQSNNILHMHTFFQQLLPYNEPNFIPHLSLLYAKITKQEAATIISDLAINNINILFNTIKLMEINYPVKNNKDLSSLITLDTLTLMN